MRLSERDLVAQQEESLLSQVNYFARLIVGKTSQPKRTNAQQAVEQRIRTSGNEVSPLVAEMLPTKNNVGRGEHLHRHFPVHHTPPRLRSVSQRQPSEVGKIPSKKHDAVRTRIHQHAQWSPFNSHLSNCNSGIHIDGYRDSLV